ncbi:sigma factor-like helix-turn-helix DNA-binding protein [Amycolatopsis sp.]|uniref:sigma factor-like helix-turn-helix DNA-binding protein n=1 Tax=Amycolatopsis sp. TaxID=37632 RepID=UPI002CD4F039|nr:sigma factor-like helix-turn-helix DNA-binding protein [Amycolatopsis sp.]HVV13409.1 sigma factor-like helix-turn-helix DNA-binding protein [Amycolatopsis sp.]
MIVLNDAAGDSVATSSGQSELDRLARDAGGGDPELIARLVAAVSPILVRYCRARMGRREGSYQEADEVAHEAGRAVLVAVPGYDGSPFLRLVHEIAVRTVDELAPGPAAPPAGTELMELLPALPALDRDIVMLRVGTGLSTEDTATVLGLSPGQVRLAQHQALLRLRSML